MGKIHVVDMPSLERALGRVRRELEAFGLWDEPMADVDVYLVPVGDAFGWQYFRGDGSIHIPRASLAKLWDWWHGSYTSLADVLRHEYAHAFADTHRSLVRCSAFRRAFGASHDDESEFEYDPDFHVSAYAATNASEDFAECFMLYLRHGGRLPRHHRTSAKRAKWRFVKELGQRVA